MRSGVMTPWGFPPLFLPNNTFPLGSISLANPLFFSYNVLFRPSSAVGPSANTFLYFSHFQNLKLIFFGNVNTLKAQLLFPFKPIFLQIFLNFQQQNPLKNQYLPHLNSENCEINSAKSDLPRAFQQPY
jgi:hypothetical protein